MQIALEKEFQAKEKLMEENTNLKHDLDARNHKINELQSQLESLNTQIGKHLTEIKQLKDDLNQYPNGKVGLSANNNGLFSPHHHQNSHELITNHSNQSLFATPNGFASNTDHLQPACSLARQPSALSTASSINNNMNNTQLNHPAINLSSSSISSASNPNYKIEDGLENSDSIDATQTKSKQPEKKPIAGKATCGRKQSLTRFDKVHMLQYLHNAYADSVAGKAS